jgi:hypothetical protein
MIKELTSRALVAGALVGLAMAAVPVKAGQSGNHLGVEAAAMAKPKPKPKPPTKPPPPLNPRPGQLCNFFRCW